MKKTEAYFIPHCDNENCDLGEFYYTCPSCNRSSIDNGMWWKQYDIREGNQEIFKCDKCDELLMVELAKNDEYRVQLNKFERDDVIITIGGKEIKGVKSLSYRVDDHSELKVSPETPKNDPFC